MIRMSQAISRVVWAIGMIVIAVAGCCGGGPTHKCDFTPPNTPTNDGGADGPMLCGTAVCEMGQVCCYKKAPPLAICIPPQDFVMDGCEKMNLPCFTPADCPEGTTCCLGLMDLTVTCRAKIQCPGDGVNTLIACKDQTDCTFASPTCSVIGQANGMDFKVCGPAPSP